VWKALFVASLQRLLDAPVLRGLARRVGGGTGDAEVDHVTLVEDVDDLIGIHAGALVVLTRGASRDATGYRLDMALKLASSRSAAALVLTDGRAGVPPTTSLIAERAQMPILATDATPDLAGLIVALEREITGAAAAALSRVGEAVAALRRAEQSSAHPDELLRTASAALGVELILGEGDDGEVSASIVVDDGPEQRVSVADAGEGHERVAAATVAELAAGAIGRARGAARRAEDAPIRSRGELLAEFLLAPPDRADRLLERMRAAELMVDGWHAAVRIEFDNLEAMTEGDELAWYRVTERVGRIALDHARAAEGVWHLAQLGSALVLLRTSRHDPGTRAGKDLTRAADHMIQGVLARMPKAVVVCGVGSVHVGPVGLRTSAAEARAALAAGRASQRRNIAVPYDEVGLKRTLMEWYASDTAREAVDSLLAPLDGLTAAKRDASIRTLRSYLDNQGSLTQAAEELHLHRNAVAYRIDKIFERLGADRSDPETRLLLQLACRARSLG
jgi:hypothetical protein